MMKYKVTQDYHTENTYDTFDAGQLANDLSSYLEENEAFFGLDVLPLPDEIRAALESMNDGDCGYYGDITVFASEAHSADRPYAEDAAYLVAAIKALANNEDALNNLECYLSRHFGPWMKNWANDPAGLACELTNFAEM